MRIRFYTDEITIGAVDKAGRFKVELEIELEELLEGVSDQELFKIMDRELVAKLMSGGAD